MRVDEPPLGTPAPSARSETALPALYLDPSYYDLLASMTAPADAPFYNGLLSEGDGPYRLLELGCGTGRLTLPWARAGHDVWGLDISGAMIAATRAKAEAASLPLTLALGDMRCIAFDGRFDLVLMPYNTVNHLLELDDIKTTFDRVHDHLHESGRLVIDTFQPDPRRLHLTPSERTLLFRYRDPTSGDEHRFFERSHYRPDHQVNSLEWEVECDGEVLRRDRFEMRVFFPQELLALLRWAGFRIEARYGSYERTPFAPESPQHLIVARAER
ncbi:MAG: class I SAM-dependent methyltransferase [Myxococcota bacterium]